ncbi:hypothetical protein Sgou_51040 [Streptomyces gougerotii]|uniref:Uncharacterized protein n=1 Tax=Streptomyces gougerotii TaxID=53448 RepID=A0A8H9HEK8_9ACTN|nr:hypothetical protein Srut_24600 [Streptomyces rutgersensis]GFH80434.1 hypothetical protein Sgou_51040 [Streptomyces gougerotii]GGU58306.1 hypothetical protein GCM10010227_09310 [Streptomyces gougerotii]
MSEVSGDIFFVMISVRNVAIMTNPRTVSSMELHLRPARDHSSVAGRKYERRPGGNKESTREQYARNPPVARGPAWQVSGTSARRLVCGDREAAGGARRVGPARRGEVTRTREVPVRVPVPAPVGRGRRSAAFAARAGLVSAVVRLERG